MLNSEFHNEYTKKLLESSVNSKTALIFNLFLISQDFEDDIQLNVHELKDGRIVQEAIDNEYLDQNPTDINNVKLMLVDENNKMIEGSGWLNPGDPDVLDVFEVSKSPEKYSHPFSVSLRMMKESSGAVTAFLWIENAERNANCSFIDKEMIEYSYETTMEGLRMAIHRLYEFCNMFGQEIPELDYIYKEGYVEKEIYEEALEDVKLVMGIFE